MLLLTKFPNMVMSYVTIVYYYSQEFDIDTIHWPYSDFASLIYSYVCLSLVLGNFIPCADLFDHHDNQDTEEFQLKDPSCYPFIAITTSSLQLP